MTYRAWEQKPLDRAAVRELTAAIEMCIRDRLLPCRSRRRLCRPSDTGYTPSTTALCSRNTGVGFSAP